MFAETTPPPPGLNSWLACLFYIAGGVYLLVKLGRAVKGRPPAGELDLRVARLEQQVADHSADNKEEFRKLDDKMEELRREGSDSRKYLHERIDRANNLLNRIAGKLGVHTFDDQP